MEHISKQLHVASSGKSMSNFLPSQLSTITGYAMNVSKRHFWKEYDRLVALIPLMYFMPNLDVKLSLLKSVYKMLKKKKILLLRQKKKILPCKMSFKNTT